jgi:hypothetical protein
MLTLHTLAVVYFGAGLIYSLYYGGTVTLSFGIQITLDAIQESTDEIATNVAATEVTVNAAGLAPHDAALTSTETATAAVVDTAVNAAVVTEPATVHTVVCNCADASEMLSDFRTFLEHPDSPSFINYADITDVVLDDHGLYNITTDNRWKVVVTPNAMGNYVVNCYHEDLNGLYDDSHRYEWYISLGLVKETFV